MSIIKKFKIKKSDIGFWTFMGAQITFLLIFYSHGIVPILSSILLTIVGAILFVCYIDKDVVPTK